MARQYTREFKLEAIHMAKEGGNVTGTARTLGLSQSALWLVVSGLTARGRVGDGGPT